MMKLNQTIIIGVAPGWIFCGRVGKIDNDEAVLTSAAWIENVSAPWTEAIHDHKKITKYNPINRITIRMAAVLWYADCPESLLGKPQLDAIKEVK